MDFDLDLSVFPHMPIKNELLIQNLEDMSDRERIKGDAIDFEGYKNLVGAFYQPKLTMSAARNCCLSSSHRYATTMKPAMV